MRYARIYLWLPNVIHVFEDVLPGLTLHVHFALNLRKPPRDRAEPRPRAADGAAAAARGGAHGTPRLHGPQCTRTVQPGGVADSPSHHGGEPT